MFYLIGLGLNEKGISIQALEILNKCKKIYIEEYTSDFPYNKKTLERVIRKKIIPVSRDFVENKSEDIILESKKSNIALLVYGSPLVATTHISLIKDLKNKKIKYKVIHSTSILDALTETGLQIYKFGKGTSMPRWTKSFRPESFIDIVMENQKINAHTIIFVDPGLEIIEALEQLNESAKDKKLKIDKIVICSRLGTKDDKIIYDKIHNLIKRKIKKPYCIIIPGKLHFMEKEFLENYS
ncbi:diphthine synthase [Candidatus Pacearchaeota archaeon]|nr:diphthine synthase [Candidatus Pacearchaeota archaeon]